MRDPNKKNDVEKVKEQRKRFYSKKASEYGVANSGEALVCYQMLNLINRATKIVGAEKVAELMETIEEK